MMAFRPEPITAASASPSRIAGDDERRDDGVQARADHGRKRQPEQDRGDGEQHIVDAHQHAVEPSVKRGDEADRHADGPADRGGDNADHQRGARAVEQPRQHTAAEAVGAEQIGPGSTRFPDRWQHAAARGEIRIMRRDPGRQQRRDHNGEQDDARGQRKPVPHKPAHHARPRLADRDGGRGGDNVAHDAFTLGSSAA
ncbi:MAG: hypothetical protein NT037_14800 [Hyphomicrobiales bacterium]|nr:hypothetical protein [Hyphomicrobiales bacterium]